MNEKLRGQVEFRKINDGAIDEEDYICQLTLQFIV